MFGQSSKKEQRFMGARVRRAKAQKAGSQKGHVFYGNQHTSGGYSAIRKPKAQARIRARTGSTGPQYKKLTVAGGILLRVIPGAKRVRTDAAGIKAAKVRKAALKAKESEYVKLTTIGRVLHTVAPKTFPRIRKR
jgi:hypothetical protein